MVIIFNLPEMIMNLLDLLNYILYVTFFELLLSK